MKIFAVSDIHSFYTPMKKALDEAGFESGNNNHLLVVCGDMFDRGDESCEVFKYLKSVPNKILVRGNHEDLLDECLDRGEPWSHDFSNGTYKTICDLGGAGYGRGFDECCNITWSLVKPLLNQMVDYYETEHYIFVHSWIPTHVKRSSFNRTYTYDDDWHNAYPEDWYNARWENPFTLAANDLNQTGKTIVFGHWHTSHGWSLKEGRSEWGEDAKFDICKYKDSIGLDACTAYSGQVNVLVIEDEKINSEKNQ